MSLLSATPVGVVDEEVGMVAFGLAVARSERVGVSTR